MLALPSGSLNKVDGIEIAPLRAAEECPRPDAQALVAWWNALDRSPDGLPSWSDVDPATLQKWMGWICLYDVIDGGRDIRYRLVGTRITEQAGIDLTGRLVSQGVYAATPGVLLEYMRQLGAKPVPTWTKRVMETQQGFAITHDRIWLPFRRAGDTLDMWLMYVCRLESGVDRLDMARLAGLTRRHQDTGLVPVTLNPAAVLRT